MFILSATDVGGLNVSYNIKSTLSNFLIPSKNLGDQSFNITDPSSNSTGAFSYTSSNNSVATIIGNTVTIVGVGSSTITATQEPSNNYASNTITTTFMVSSKPLAPICFIAGTPVKTDQGLIAIEKINTNKNTIRGKSIVAITETICPQKHLVCIEKDSLGPNIPSQKTITTKDHKIFYNKQMIEPRKLVGQVDGIYYIENKGEILYNVLMEQHDKMIVNNMITETLHPDNIIAKLYTGNFTEEEKINIVIKLNDCVKSNSERKFKKLVKYMTK